MPKSAHRLVFVTGASGVGKTSTLRMLEHRRSDFIFRSFDSIGVPLLEEMIKECGTGEEWQRRKTIEWIRRIKAEDLDLAPVIIDGQARQSFVDEGCRLAALHRYRTILFDCEDRVREKRLIARGHPELANSEMASWASYLREQASKRGDPVVNTTALTIADAAHELERALSR
jgi:RNase adaptor protein for sRNA GlmZ degradation